MSSSTHSIIFKTDIPDKIKILGGSFNKSNRSFQRSILNNRLKSVQHIFFCLAYMSSIVDTNFGKILTHFLTTFCYSQTKKKTLFGAKFLSFCGVCVGRGLRAKIDLSKYNLFFSFFKHIWSNIRFDDFFFFLFIFLSMALLGLSSWHIFCFVL